jgi:hypothetical protein
MPRAHEIIEEVVEKLEVFKYHRFNKKFPGSIFCTPFDIYTFEVMPFVMQNSTATDIQVVLKEIESFVIFSPDCLSLLPIKTHPSVILSIIELVSLDDVDYYLFILKILRH